MAIEDIIREARTRYPIGSKFIDLVHGETFTVSSHVFDSFGDNCQLYIPVEAHISKPNKTARIYKNGKWADSVDVETGEILLENPKSPMEQVQEECKRRFPIGCEYVAVKAGKHSLLSDDYTYSIHGDDIWAHSGGGVLYKEGIYAELVTPDKSKMEIIQEECKRRFPIGCTYICVEGGAPLTLMSDSSTYSIHSDCIYTHCGGGYLYLDGVYAELVTPDKSKMEIIQEECKKRFPAGCIYISANGGSAQKLKIDNYTYSINGNEIWAHCAGGYLYKDGEYAVTTHSNPLSKMEQVQEECKRRFPIGCKFKCAYGSYEQTLLSDDYTYSISGNEIWANRGGGYLYQNGMYAELIEPDDWMVKGSNPEISGTSITISGTSTTISTSPRLIQEVSFKRIGAMRNNKVQFDKLIEEVGFKRIKSK